MFKFIHAADIHLDSPLRGLERYDEAPVDALRGATRQAFSRLIDLALEEEVAFVVIAGDLYDGDWKDYSTGLFFSKEIGRLGEAGIGVYLIAGNHDAASRMTRALRLPRHVHRFSHRKPETFVRDDVPVALHGQSFARAAVEENLVENYPAALPDRLNIGVLHTSLSGYSEHETYAPCQAADLLAKGYDYWALGHVHRAQVIHEDPWIVFPGNLQGRHARETGEKGCYLVEADATGVERAEPVALDVVRWLTCPIDASTCATADEVRDAVETELESLVDATGGMPLAVRVEVSGRTAAHRELVSRREAWEGEFRAAAIGIGRADVWLEKISWRTQPERELAEPEEEGPLAEIAELVAELQARDETFDELELGSGLPHLARKLRSVLGADTDVSLQSPEDLRPLLDVAYEAIRQRLQPADEAP